MLEGMNHFAKNPTTIKINRSAFNRPSTYKTTFRSGELIPVFCDEVLPGDTFKLNSSFVLRNLTTTCLAAPPLTFNGQCLYRFLFFLCS